MKLFFNDLRVGDRFKFVPNETGIVFEKESSATCIANGKSTFIDYTGMQEVEYVGNPRLKMTFPDQWRVREAIIRQDTPDRRADYLAGRFPRADNCKDVEMRYRWDTLRATGLKIGNGVGIKGDIDLYAYLDDENIDAALRSIIKPLQTRRSK